MDEALKVCQTPSLLIPAVMNDFKGLESLSGK